MKLIVYRSRFCINTWSHKSFPCLPRCFPIFCSLRHCYLAHSMFKASATIFFSLIHNTIRIDQCLPRFFAWIIANIVSATMFSLILSVCHNVFARFKCLPRCFFSFDSRFFAHFKCLPPCFSFAHSISWFKMSATMFLIQISVAHDISLIFSVCHAGLRIFT